jgi:hypothetical protein
MADRHLETSLHRLHQSRFLRRPEGTLWVLKAIPQLQISLKQLRPCFFYDQNAENVFAWTFDTLKHHFIDFNKVVFKTSRRKIEFSKSFVYFEHHLSNFV